MRRALLPLALAALALGAPAARAAKVTTMVVGRQRVLHAPALVTLKQRTVKVGGRRCAVGARTPLAALAGLHMTLRLHDYGRCGARTGAASSLYVTRIGPDAPSGANGWVYKRNHRAGSVGAGVASLRGGDRLLWFWCRMQPTGGCQRTLQATPERAVAHPGKPLRVTVRGYDDDGHGTPIAGAAVRLGGAAAVTGSDGVATVTVPTAGNLRLTATAAGLVPAFGELVRAG
jgi:hypothetical protein